MSIVIHHNPDCGTSRNVLEMIKASGEAPVIIEYIKEGWSKAQKTIAGIVVFITPPTENI